VRGGSLISNVKLRIIVDADEVIVDLIPAVIKDYNKKYKSDITLNDIVSWGLPKDMRKIYEKKDYFLSLSPVEDAIESMYALKAQGHDLIIATSPSYSGNIASCKIQWVEKRMPDFRKNLCITNRKDFFDADIMIDDCLDHLKTFSGIRFIMNKPWNQEFLVNSIRVNNWNEILSNINKICNEWKKEK
jgi:5'(3')-deoxyribonucleotidase